MIIHHDTKFGKNGCAVQERLSGQDQTHGETGADILNLHCDLDLVRSNPIFPQDTLASDAVLANQVWLQTNQQFRRYNRNCHILIV